MTTLVLVLMAFSGMQDDVARRVEALGDEELARREEAWAALRKAGLPALAAVEKATRSADRDVADLAKRLAQVIRDDAQRASVFGPANRITIDVTREKFSTALREIDRQTGFVTATAPSVEDRPVTLRLRDCLYLEALDLLCEAHGAAHVAGRKASEAGRLKNAEEEDYIFAQVEPGASPKAPTFYDGPFRMRLEGIALHRPARSQLSYSVLWQPNVRPLRAGVAWIENAIDDRGTDLVSPERRAQDTRARAEPVQLSRALFTGTSTEFELLPHLDANRLVSVRGRVGLVFLLDKRTVDFDLAKDTGTKRECGDLVLECRAGAPDKTSYRASVAFTPADERRTGRLDVTSSMQILDANGQALPANSCGGSWEGGRTIFTTGVVVAPGSVPATLRVHVSLRAFTEEFPFEFRDVPLPQW